MTTIEKKQLYENIMKEVSIKIKKLLDSYIVKEQKTVTNKKFISQVFSQSKETLNQTYNKNVYMLKRICVAYINEANGEDIKYLLQFLLSGKSPFGSHKATEINGFNPSIHNADMTKTGVIMAANAYSVPSEFKLYHFDKWQFSKSYVDGIYYMDIVIPKNSPELKTFLEILKKQGYHFKIQDDIFINYKQEYLQNDITPEQEDIIQNWTYLRIFERDDNNERNDIRKYNRYLYHYTVKSNKESIIKKGIIANNESHPEYPKRVFMIVKNRPNNSSDKIYNFQLYSDALLSSIIKHYNKKYHNTLTKNDFMEVVIDIDMLPSDIQLSYDYNSYPYAVYSNSNIPSKSIIGFNDL